MLITGKELCEGSVLPKWYYGLAYRDFVRDTTIWYPIFLHLFVRFTRNLYHAYIKYFLIARCKPSLIDQLLIEQSKKVKHQLETSQPFRDRIVQQEIKKAFNEVNKSRS